MSSADYSGKRAVLVLFINGRPVECAPLKRALEATYAAVLPKAAKPFVFLVQYPGCTARCMSENMPFVFLVQAPAAQHDA